MLAHKQWIEQDEYRTNDQRHRTMRSDDRWIMDTGCSAHMTGNWSLMRNTRKCNKTVCVTIALGEKTWATHVGTVDILLKEST